MDLFGRARLTLWGEGADFEGPKLRRAAKVFNIWPGGVVNSPLPVLFAQPGSEVPEEKRVAVWQIHSPKTVAESTSRIVTNPGAIHMSGGVALGEKDPAG